VKIRKLQKGNESRRRRNAPSDSSTDPVSHRNVRITDRNGNFPPPPVGNSRYGENNTLGLSGQSAMIRFRPSRSRYETYIESQSSSSSSTSNETLS